ncbi:MAG: lysine--tRNA ligase, partial [Candidatus Pacebacteria bacterium]|nr:lysine--tRNA ligase [Candidatus Paceibacterota bacterium]
IKKQGINPYPAKTKRTYTISQALLDFNKLEKAKKNIILAGRIRLIRSHGKSLFLHFEDGSGKIQAYLKQDILGEKKYKFFTDNFDIGDFIEIKGTLFKTKTKEKTIKVKDFKILTKSLRPLPEKWHGLKDEEERFRKRYLDFIFNPEIKDMFRKKAIFWNSMREFLNDKGFLEVETPVLETVAGGADANPFSSHHNALDINVYLRISMGELWQKRLMVAGFEKTFEIGRQFRNEGMSKEHLQDYTQMEFYWAYADYEDGMKLVEKMYKYVIKKTFKTLKFKIFGFNIDFNKKWRKIDYKKEILSKFKIDIEKTTIKEVKDKLNKLKVEYDKNLGLGRLIDVLWKQARKDIAGPVFLIGHPVMVSPLSKKDKENDFKTERFQVIIAGSEMGNGYSELNDPIDQAERFAEQAKMREKGDLSAQMHDYDFVEALEYGMPPTCGFGVSERLFSFLMDKPVRECVMFPLMRPKK